MKKRQAALFLILTFVMCLTACGQKASASTWQEQYDLGVRYLSEGNYEAAIIAFSAAIEIDPKQAIIYIGRGDASVLSGESEESLATALADYEAALVLDDTCVNAYLGMADVYIRQGNYDQALELLKQALTITNNNQNISDKLNEMLNGTYTDSSSKLRRKHTYDMDGVMTGYTDHKYDIKGNGLSWHNYDRDKNNGEYLDTFSLSSYCMVISNEKGQVEQYQFYSSDGTMTSYDTLVYNEFGTKSEQYRYSMEGVLEHYFLFFYDDDGNRTRYEGYNSEGKLTSYFLSEYDESGNFVREVQYLPNGEAQSYHD